MSHESKVEEELYRVLKNVLYKKKNVIEGVRFVDVEPQKRADSGRADLAVIIHPAKTLMVIECKKKTGGNARAVQLARMGVKKLRLIDRDVVDESNMARVYGSTFKDGGYSKKQRRAFQRLMSARKSTRALSWLESLHTSTAASLTIRPFCFLEIPSRAHAFDAHVLLWLGLLAPMVQGYSPHNI